MALDDDDMSMEEGEESASGGTPAPSPGWRGLFSGRRGWIILAVIALLQAVFASVMLSLRSVRQPLPAAQQAEIRALAIDMLGREVGISGINQVISGARRHRMTVGLDLVLVLGQLPEERIEGSPRPTDLEMETFIAAINALDPKIRSRMITMLQAVKYEEYGDPAILDRFKSEIRDYVNDELEKLDFSTVRPEIGRRRVTEALLPMFVRQSF